MSAADVAVIGAGICGLTIARNLTQRGVAVDLFEQSTRIASGPSSHSHGLWHCGTYHSGAADDRRASLRATAMLSHGVGWLRAAAPESIELGGPTIALLDDRANLDERTERWAAAGVPFRPLGRVETADALPEVRLESTVAAFEVADFSVNTSLLYRILLRDFGAAGGELRLRQEIGLDPANPALPHRLVIVAVGADLNRLLAPLRVRPVRLWQSCLIRGPRLTRRNVLWLDGAGATIVNHAPSSSVVGVSNLDVPVEDVTPSATAGQVRAIRDALARMVIGVNQDMFDAYACRKVDVDADRHRSVEPALIDLGPTAFAVLPGKISFAPYVADEVAGLVATWLREDQTRPWLEHGLIDCHPALDIGVAGNSGLTGRRPMGDY